MPKFLIARATTFSAMEGSAVALNPRRMTAAV
jgi:hypothetical protein